MLVKQMMSKTLQRLAIGSGLIVLMLGLVQTASATMLSAVQVSTGNPYAFTAPIPEPSTLVLVAMSLLGYALRRQRVGRVEGRPMKPFGMFVVVLITVLSASTAARLDAATVTYQIKASSITPGDPGIDNGLGELVVGDTPPQAFVSSVYDEITQDHTVHFGATTAAYVSADPNGALHASAGARLTATDSGGSPVYAGMGATAHAHANIYWQDFVQLVGPDISNPSYRYLVLHFELSGNLFSEMPLHDPPSYALGSSANVAVISYGMSTDAIGGSNNITGGIRDESGTPSGAFDSRYQLSNGTVTITYGLQTWVNVVLGEANANYSHTMGLSAVTFDDGTTPESHGFSLQFDSGMPSPNLVPEPGTLVLLGCGLLALLASAWRRRR